MTNEDKWVLVTNYNRFVGIPFITSLNKRSPVYDNYKENEMRILHFKTEKTALEYITKYNSPQRDFVLDIFMKKKREHVNKAVNIKDIVNL